MAEGWLTLSDIYNPMEAQLRAQQIQANVQQLADAKQQAQLKNLAIQKATEENAKRGLFNDYISGNTPNAAQPVIEGQQEQMPPAPQIDPEMAQIIRGKSKVDAVMPEIGKQFEAKSLNSSAINKLNKMTKNDPDIQAVLKATGFDDVDFGYDEKNSEAWHKFTKNWTKEELEKIGEAPGGEVIGGLPPGRYTIDYDPINKRFRPIVKSASADNQNLTGDTKLISDSLREKLGRNPTASEILKEKDKREVSNYDSKYGSNVDFEAINFAAEQYIESGKMPSLGRSSKVRTEILGRAAEIKRERGLTTREIIGGQASLESMTKSLNNQQKVVSMMGSFVRNIDQQVDRLNKVLPLIERTDARALNLPWRNYKTRIKGSANEAILDMYLTEISSEVGKLSTGSSASISELSASAREKWEKIHDPNLPIGELIKLVKETQEAAHLRMQSAQDEIESTRNVISGGAKEKAINSRTRETKKRFTILAVE